MSRARRSAFAGLRVRASSLGELAAPACGQPAADPLAGDELHLRRPLAHLGERRLVGVEVQLRRRSAVPRTIRSGSSREAPRSRSCAARRASGLPARRAGRASSPVSSRFASALIVKSRRSMSWLERDRRVGDDLEIVVAGARRALDARRRELDPGRGERAHVTVAREQARADVLAGDDEVLDLPVRLERGPQLGVANAGNDEVGVADRLAEQLVADRAAHNPGVEPERAT